MGLEVQEVGTWLIKFLKMEKPRETPKNPDSVHQKCSRDSNSVMVVITLAIGTRIVGGVRFGKELHHDELRILKYDMKENWTREIFIIFVKKRRFRYTFDIYF